MKNKQEWFNEKMAAVSPEIMSEVQLSVEIIARIDVVLKQKNMTQRELAKKMGRSEAVCVHGKAFLAVSCAKTAVFVHGRAIMDGRCAKTAVFGHAMAAEEVIKIFINFVG